MPRRIFFSVIALLLAACATSTYTVGKDFPSDNVSKIERGTTTSKQLLSMFGEPFSKAVISADEEKWIYTYTNGKAKAQSYVVTMKVETTGTQKMLDVLLKNGVVVNYTFSEGQNPYTTRIN